MTTIYVSQSTPLPERAPNDLYRTERSLIAQAMQRYALANAQTILDLGAGDGRWGQGAALFSHPFDLVGVELADAPRPAGFTEWFAGQDYLAWQWDGYTFDMIVGNPPYRHAEAFIRKSWDWLTPNGRMVFLLPLDFMASKARYEGLWNEIPPVEVAVCSNRPSFYGGGTNGSSYGLYVWDKDRWGMPAGQARRWTVNLLLHARDTSTKDGLNGCQN